MKNFWQKYEESLSRISKNEKLSSFIIELCKIGKPVETSTQVKTAGVYFCQTEKRIIFIFNKDFHQTLTDEEFDFMVCHEALHVLLSHTEYISDIDLIKKFEAGNKQKFIKKFRIASDCVVNDTLVNKFEIKKCFENFAYFGMKTINENCENKYVMEVYNKIPDDFEEKETFDEHLEPQSSNGEIKEILNKINKNIEGEEKTEFDEKLQKEISNENFSRNEIEIKSKKNKIKWNKILNKITQEIKEEDSWIHINKAINHIYPEIILPSTQLDENTNLLVAIDVSYSIPYETLTFFINACKGLPKKFNIKFVSFTTYCQEIKDIKKYKISYGGGTYFQSIEDYIQKNLKNKYPHVIVLTDGDGGDVYPQYKDKWFWILCGEHPYKEYCKNMKYFLEKQIT